MACDPIWATYLSALLTPTIAIFGLLIARRQWRLAQNKLKLDLYQRRFAVYESTLDFYQELVTCDLESIQSETFNNIQKRSIKSMRESQFLFESDSGVFQLLYELHQRSVKITGFKTEGRTISQSSPEDFLKMSKESNDALKFFGDSIITIETLMAPYLDFKKITA